MANCIYCKEEIPEGSTFCLHCGKKQVKRYTQVFRRGNLNEEDFIHQINVWFAKYPYVANVQCKFQVVRGFGMLVNHYVLEALSIEYETFSGDNEYQYGLIKLGDMGLTNISSAQVLLEWKKANPAARIVNCTGGTNQRGHVASILMGGFGAVNNTQVYVFFKFKRAKPNTWPQP